MSLPVACASAMSVTPDMPPYRRRNISTYLDLPEVRSYLGVSERIGNWTACSNKVAQAFADSMDETDMTWLYVAGLLERKIPVISYVGTYDWICNYIGNEAWLEDLEWTGSMGYKTAEVRDWEVEGKVAGYTKTFGGLTFATVAGAGHMVPMDSESRVRLSHENSWESDLNRPFSLVQSRSKRWRC